MINEPCEAQTTNNANIETDVNNVYPDVFQGLGHMPGTVHLELNESATPAVMPPRRVPIAIKQTLKEELDRLEERQIITKVVEPTDWISSLVTVQKPNGKIRMEKQIQKIYKGRLSRTNREQTSENTRFLCNGDHPESGSQCKKKWQDLGQVVSRKVTHNKWERTRTEGVPANLQPLTPLEERVAALMSPAWRKATTTVQAGPILEGEEFEANPDDVE
uniref:uncharacterized protein n=1 Tax=Pristiophorus japonicus TaxID=55135 RepID=UPI00398E4F2B